MVLIMGFRTTQLMRAAARLGIADRISRNGPQDAVALATDTGADPRALRRLLRALASLGVFAARPDGRFQLTPIAETLRSDVSRIGARVGAAVWRRMGLG